jgi:hypothetical protein
MAKLEKEQQEFIIECFARYLPPREIIILVKDNFAIDVSYQDLYHYNPKHKNTLSKELRQHFLECREEYNKNTVNIGGASKSFRVEQLTEIFFEAKKSKNYKLAIEIMKQLEEMDKSQEGSGQVQANTAIKELIFDYVSKQQDPSHSKAVTEIDPGMQDTSS